MPMVMETVQIADPEADTGYRIITREVFEPDSSPPQMPPLSAPRMKAMLRISGKMDAVNAAIAAIPIETARILAEETLAGSGSYHRLHPLTDQIRKAIGMTDAELDALWMMAAAL